MVLNFPAPHGPEDAHPDYRHVYDQPSEYEQGILGAHRDLVFNKTSWQPGEKHLFIASQKEMNEVKPDLRISIIILLGRWSFH